MNITIFKNIKDTSTPFVRDIHLILDRIKSGKCKDLIQSIRKEKDKDERNKLKQDLPAICFSGIFAKREDKALEQHSGFICLDFDGFKTKKAMLAKKQEIQKDKYVYSVFISPSGNGLKVIVKIPAEPEHHCEYFKALEKYFGCEEFDKSCKNISRVCYESYDPDIYINTDADIWTDMEEEESSYINYGERATIRITDHGEVVRRLMKWWKDKYPMVSGERNNNMFVIAAAFNKFGIDKSLAEFILMDYSTKGFSEQEIRTTIKSAYRETAEHNTRFFEDTEAVDDIKLKIKQGTSDKKIRHELKEKGVEEGEVDEVIEQINEDANSIYFWTISNKGVVTIIHNLFKEFLEDNGIYKYCPPGSDSFIYVRVKDNLISNTSVESVKDFVLNWLYTKGDMNVYNHFADKTRYFKEDFLGMLQSIDAYFVRDDKHTAYIYYENCAVKVTKDVIELIDYIDLGGYVWADQVIEREFEITDTTECDFQTFIGNVSGSPKNKISVESTIGFLLHGFKNQSYCPAVILNDEIISEDNPEGGTGKGLFVNGVSKMKKLVTIDGKAFSFEKSFAYQTVSQDTQVLCFDDVRKSFHFERLFSVVTEGITLEKKNKDAIKIPFSQSPKLVITTNYAIVGKGNSFERRKWELEFRKFYHKNFTPLDEFKRLLFTDWDTEEWTKFDNYMIQCLKGYLKTGFVIGEFKNMNERKLQAATSIAFYEWVMNPLNLEDINFDVKVYQHTLWHSFITEFPHYDKMKISPQKFGKWLKEYAYYKTGIEPSLGKDRNGKFFIFHLNDPVSVPF